VGAEQRRTSGNGRGAPREQEALHEYVVYTFEAAKQKGAGESESEQQKEKGRSERERGGASESAGERARARGSERAEQERTGGVERERIHSFRYAARLW